jgi:MFS family permease
MSYEYNPQTGAFELPNPFRLENICLLIGGFVLMAAGLGAVLLARGALDAHQAQAGSTVAIVFGVLAILMGILIVGRAFVQLRYFFGRDYQALLETVGDTLESSVKYEPAALTQRMREGALQYTRPSGPINGLLYAMAPALVTSPKRVRELTESQFASALIAFATFLSFALSWLLYGDKPYMGLLAAIYAAIAIGLVYLPAFTGRSQRNQIIASLELVLLLLTPILAPIALGSISAVMFTWLPSTVFGLLLLFALAAGLALLASIKHLTKPERIETACEQRSLSFNAPPGALYDELDRELQRRWQDRIPNIKRIETRPNTAAPGGAGAFTMARFDETQPMPNRLGERLGFGAAFASPRERYLACSSVFLTLCLIAASVTLLLTCKNLSQGQLPNPAALCFFTGLVAIAAFVFRQSHLLWGRVEFLSQLIWVEAEGSYRTAQMALGNALTSEVQTKSQVVNVENMTLRVWVTDLVSVGYGPNSGREIISLNGRLDVAQTLANQLETFSRQQSGFVAPTSDADARRAQAVQSLNVGGAAANESDVKKLFALQQAAMNRDAMDKPPS